MGFMAADVIAVRNASRNSGIKQHLLSAGLYKKAMFVPPSHSLILQDILSPCAFIIVRWINFHLPLQLLLGMKAVN